MTPSNLELALSFLLLVALPPVVAVYLNWRDERAFKRALLDSREF